MPGEPGREYGAVAGELVTTYEGLTLSNGTKGDVGTGDSGESSLAELPLERGLRVGLPDSRNEPLPAVLNDDLDDFLAQLAVERTRELADACLNSDM